jgi:hypothetical protein
VAQQAQDEEHASFFPPARDEDAAAHPGIGSSANDSCAEVGQAALSVAPTLLEGPESSSSAGGSMAELYASLASVLPSPAVVVSARAVSRPVVRAAPAAQSSRRAHAAPDWFGGRPGRGFLVAPPASTSAAAAGTSAAAILPQVEASDAFCPLCQISVPALQARDHATSIAHQLLLPLSAPAPRQPRGVKTGPAQEQREQDERLLLDARNRGYRALARMGWQEGMGLGEAEVRRLREMEESRRLREMEETQKEEERQRAKRMRQEVRIGQTQEREGSRAKPIELGSEDEMEQEAESFSSLKRSHSASPPPPATPAADQPRARIIPLQPTARPDRRGIGTSLPSASASASSSSSSRRRLTLNATAARHAELVRTGRRTESKSVKRERLERERERARATRAMLDF